MLRLQHPELLMKLLRKIYIGCWSQITTSGSVVNTITNIGQIYKAESVNADLKLKHQNGCSLLCLQCYFFLQGQIIIRAACLMCGMV